MKGLTLFYLDLTLCAKGLLLKIYSPPPPPSPPDIITVLPSPLWLGLAIEIDEVNDVPFPSNVLISFRFNEFSISG